MGRYGAPVFLLCLGIFVISSMGSRPAYAGWSAMPGGILGSSPDQVANAWAQFYSGSYSMGGTNYDSFGRFNGYKYTITRPNGQVLPEVTTPSCASDPNGHNSDSTAPSGCSNATQPTPKQLGDPGPNLSCPCGDPINIINGNVTASVTDYQSAGPDILRFTRFYNSFGQSRSSLGLGWQSNFDRHLINDGFGSVHINLATYFRDYDPSLVLWRPQDGDAATGTSI